MGRDRKTAAADPGEPRPLAGVSDSGPRIPEPRTAGPDTAEPRAEPKTAAPPLTTLTALATPRPGRRTAFVVALVLTAAAVLQQLLLVVGFGSWIPGWQPWPFLLGAAPAWAAVRSRWQRPSDAAPWAWTVRQARRIPVWACVGGVLALATGVWAWLQDKEPHLGHEEAVYANKARSWLSGTPDAGWGSYRPVGLPALGRMALALHNDVGALRAVALVLTLFTLTTVYLVAARWTSRRRAAVAVLILLSGLGLLRRIPEFLNDIGTTGLLLIVVFLLTRAQEKARSKALLLLPFVALAAFYLRYGAVGNLLGVSLAAVVAYGPRAWLAHGRHLVFAATVLIAGLLPHFVYAARETGSPLGLILSAADQANRGYVGDGFVYYLAIFPYRLAGDLGAVVMVAGLVAAGRSARRLRNARGLRNTRPLLPAQRPGSPGSSPVGTPRTDDRRTVFLAMSAVLVCVILGAATDGEPRFIYLPVVLLTVLGVSALADFAGRASAQVLTSIAVLAALTVLGTAQVVAHGAMPGPARLGESTTPVARRLASAVPGHAPGSRPGPGSRPCLLVTGYEPEMGWYSGCDAITYGQYRARRPHLPDGITVSLVLFEHGRLQPGPASLKRLVGRRETTVLTVPTPGSIGTATVITLR
jgi:hypothetical protein